jgi:hypothetical protein
VNVNAQALHIIAKLLHFNLNPLSCDNYTSSMTPSKRFTPEKQNPSCIWEGLRRAEIHSSRRSTSRCNKINFFNRQSVAMARTPRHEPAAGLMSLPVELRLKIFQDAAITYVVIPAGQALPIVRCLGRGLSLFLRNNSLPRSSTGTEIIDVKVDPTLRQTCKQIEAEVTDTIFAGHKFEFGISKRLHICSNIATNLSFLRLVRHLRISIDERNFQFCAVEAAALGGLMAVLKTSHMLSSELRMDPPGPNSPSRKLWNKKMARAQLHFGRSIRGQIFGPVGRQEVSAEAVLKALKDKVEI